MTEELEEKFKAKAAVAKNLLEKQKVAKATNTSKVLGIKAGKTNMTMANIFIEGKLKLKPAKTRKSSKMPKDLKEFYEDLPREKSGEWKVNSTPEPALKSQGWNNVTYTSSIDFKPYHHYLNNQYNITDTPNINIEPMEFPKDKVEFTWSKDPVKDCEILTGTLKCPNGDTLSAQYYISNEMIFSIYKNQKLLDSAKAIATTEILNALAQKWHSVGFKQPKKKADIPTAVEAYKNLLNKQTIATLKIPANNQDKIFIGGIEIPNELATTKEPLESDIPTPVVACHPSVKAVYEELLNESDVPCPITAYEYCLLVEEFGPKSICTSESFMSPFKPPEYYNQLFVAMKKAKALGLGEKDFQDDSMNGYENFLAKLEDK